MVATFLFDAIQKLGARGMGPRLRALGFRLYKSGVTIGGSDITYESVMPPSERVKVNDAQPSIGFTKLIGQGTSIIGNVIIAENCTIQFHNLIQAGPGSAINIDKNASIHDLVIIKADQGKTVKIGKDAIISSNAYLRNCTVGENGFVGIGAKVYDGCVVNGMLGAGAVLLEGETVPEDEIWVGNPAAFIRYITEEERDHNKDLVFQYSKIGEIVAEEMENPIEEQILLEQIRNDTVDTDFSMNDYKMRQRARNEGLPFADEDYYTAKRIMDIETIEDMDRNLKGKKMTEDYVSNYEGFPKNFNNHKANYTIHNQLKEKVETDSDMQRPDYSSFEKHGQVAKPENWTRKY